MMNTAALLLLFAAGPLATDPFKVDPFAEARRAVESDPFASYKKPTVKQSLTVQKEASRKAPPFVRSGSGFTRDTIAPTRTVERNRMGREQFTASSQSADPAPCVIRTLTNAPTARHVGITNCGPSG